MRILSPDLQACVTQIKLLILDVDGVLTDGRIFTHDNGEEIRSFSTLDSRGLKMLQVGGVQTAVITGRDTSSVGMRVQQLGIRYCFKSVSDKRAACTELRKQVDVEEHEYAHVDDDVADLPVMVHRGLSVVVPDAYQFTLQHAAYVTRRRGGCGAVCKVCDLIIRVKGTLDAVLSEYVK